MKKYLLGLLLIVSAIPAFAEITATTELNDRPCRVVAVDRFNRVVAHFYGHTDRRSPICRSALRQCNYEIRMRGWWGVRCTQLRTRW